MTDPARHNLQDQMTPKMHNKQCSEGISSILYSQRQIRNQSRTIIHGSYAQLKSVACRLYFRILLPYLKNMNCECPVHSQVLIHWYRDLNHTSSNHISHEGRTHKRTSSMYLECVNQILICRDEDRQYGEANGNRGRKSRPQTDRRESSPSHPEQPNW
jgi:hypothetical protein